MGVAPLPVLILLIVLTVSCVLHCVHRKRHDVTAQQRITKNPVTLVHRVTQYALQSPTSPGHRGFLARLNNARQSKGGPADDEDVDNVTKFLFLVLLMASLFGFFFWDDMWAMSFISYVIHANINNRGDFYWPIYAFMSSQVATSAVVAICVPIYQCIIRPFMGKRSFPLLWRIFVGLVLQLASLALLTWIGATTTSRLDSDELSEFCDYSRIDGASRPDNEGELTSWYILAIPQLINGISHLLVIPAVLELILTDAPRIMQGLLIGLWYSMQSIHVLVSIIETATCAVFYWQYYLMKISLVLLSIIAFGVVSWFYKRNQVMRINRATSMQSQNQVVANNEDTC